MINFKKLMLDDISIVREYFYKSQYRTCDFTIGGMLMWRDYFQIEYCIFNNNLLFKMNYDGDIVFAPPIGDDILEGVNDIVNYCKEQYYKCIFEISTDFFISIIDGKYDIVSKIEKEQWFDYLYNTDEFLIMKGGRYHRIRNHISVFNKTYFNCVYKEIRLEDIDDILKFVECEIIEKDSVIFDEEIEKTKEVLNNYEQYGMLGCVLRHNGEVIGFSVGEIYNDEVYVHIEKGNKDYNGIYQVLAYKFIEYCKGKCENLIYFNREEDVGDEGLKKSKLAYLPIEIIKKYRLELCI